MIKEFVKKWYNNKHKLEAYFQENKQIEYDNYEKIVALIFKYIINDSQIKFDYNNIHVIDDGDYQGTQVFIIPKNRYQPDETDYIVTSVYYGSCSGCDTLLRISNYGEGLPNDKQVEEYMTLALHLVQKMKWLYDNYEIND